ncbi:hypothetical protein C5612_02565 [Pseudomonas frederiksbergensis]|uniref:Uncharacterized protein n=1 Tax=Pseudomonas frederiksbergensis TaxID=104087 RepID=A0A2S8HVR9_9PSED|nr:hypothetical protein C5612_02565 [Pseudomonas frederiksbergensis]
MAAVRRLANRYRETGRSEDLPRTAAINSGFAGALAPAIKLIAFAFSIIRSPNLNRHLGDGRTISFIVPAVQDDCFRGCCRAFAWRQLGNAAYRTLRNFVGASLLAIAVYQSTSMLNVSQSSRAGSLPQWIGGVHTRPMRVYPPWQQLAGALSLYRS